MTKFRLLQQVVWSLIPCAILAYSWANYGGLLGWSMAFIWTAFPATWFIQSMNEASEQARPKTPPRPLESK